MTQLIAELPASGRAVPWYRSLRTRLVLWICVGCVAVLLAATLIVQARSAQLLTAQSEREIRTLAEQTALGLHATLESVEVGATTLGEAVRGVGRDPRTLDALLRATVAGDDDIAGAMLVLEPGALMTAMPPTAGTCAAKARATTPSRCARVATTTTTSRGGSARSAKAAPGGRSPIAMPPPASRCSSPTTGRSGAIPTTTPRRRSAWSASTCRSAACAR